MLSFSGYTGEEEKEAGREEEGEERREEDKEIKFYLFQSKLFNLKYTRFQFGRAGEFSACCFHQLEKPNRLWEGLP